VVPALFIAGDMVHSGIDDSPVVLNISILAFLVRPGATPRHF